MCASVLVVYQCGIAILQDFCSLLLGADMLVFVELAENAAMGVFPSLYVYCLVFWGTLLRGSLAATVRRARFQIHRRILI